MEILRLYTKNNFIGSPFIKAYNIQKTANLEINENILSILNDMTSDSADIPCFNRSDISILQSNVRQQKMSTDQLLQHLVRLGILPQEHDTYKLSSLSLS